MKKNYDFPRIEFVQLMAGDVIATSAPQAYDKEGAEQVFGWAEI